MKKEKAIDPDFMEEIETQMVAREERSKRVISAEENEQFKAAFDEDHPDFVQITETKSDEELQAEKDRIMYGGKTRDEYWESQKRVYPSKSRLNFKGKEFKFKPSGKKYIPNQLLGITTQEILDYAIDTGAIVQKKLWNNYYYCIPTEKVFLGDSKAGKAKETFVVSKKYLQFREDLKNGKLDKLIKKTLL